MKLALIHDHLTQEGGAEKVLKVFHDIYPKAPTYTLFYDKKKMSKVFEGKDIRTSFLQNWPGALKHYQWFLPFMPTATESYDLMDYDVVISSSSAMSKGVITRSNTLHFCYCHTPTRYLWSDTHRYIDELKYNRLIKRFIPPVLTKLRAWDQLAAQRVDFFIANSKNVADRIQKYYRRDSIIIHPPVATNQFKISDKIENYYLTGGRLVAYKRFDIAIQAFNRLGIPLKIFGSGPELNNLKRLAKSNIEFLDRVSQDELAKLYSRATAFVHPQIEDFGITAVESMAAGRPVIAYAAGGACETVVDKKTGKFFDEQTWEALADAIVRFKPEDFKPEEVKNYAQQFSEERFKKEITNLVEAEWEKLKSTQIKCGI
ncbi:MAG: glycosyl transferase [Parcubacteria group bacterium]|nr:glycosyl transferase [Parcubacteria group bacterium]|tara:strand:+ start:5692 stop:6810 length:1119 start_codon:yes stop_codon:yes gene_type:complete